MVCFTLLLVVLHHPTAATTCGQELGRDKHVMHSLEDRKNTFLFIHPVTVHARATCGNRVCCSRICYGQAVQNDVRPDKYDCLDEDAFAITRQQIERDGATANNTQGGFVLLAAWPIGQYVRHKYLRIAHVAPLASRYDISQLTTQVHLSIHRQHPPRELLFLRKRDRSHNVQRDKGVLQIPAILYKQTCLRAKRDDRNCHETVAIVSGACFIAPAPVYDTKLIISIRQLFNRAHLHHIRRADQAQSSHTFTTTHSA